MSILSLTLNKDDYIEIFFGDKVVRFYVTRKNGTRRVHIDAPEEVRIKRYRAKDKHLASLLDSLKDEEK